MAFSESVYVDRPDTENTMIILYNPPSSAQKKPILPMSLLALGAVLEGHYEYRIVDGNLHAEPEAALAVSIDICSAQKQTPDQLTRVGGLGKELDDDLLSHGETPHYHRRYLVSRLSSGWDQVVPRFYDRQANWSSLCRCVVDLLSPIYATHTLSVRCRHCGFISSHSNHAF